MEGNRCVGVLMGALLFMQGCTSVGSLGIVTRSQLDNAAILSSGKPFEELGYVEGESCRYFALAVVPWGDSTFSKAVDQALARTGGDALINVTVSSGLYGFVPIYNVFSFTCTKVSGIAVKFK